jgi:formate dehydrogenase iron-sulfur subunit
MLQPPIPPPQQAADALVDAAAKFDVDALEVIFGPDGIRGQFAGAIAGKLGALFAIEILVGGVLPLALLSRATLRARPIVLLCGALLTTLGVVFNRINVVILAMHLKGPMPQIAPASYSPTIFEWGVSIGLIAATIFLFGLGARLVPLLPKEETAESLNL